MVQRVYSIQVDDSKSAPGEGPTQRSILSASGLMTTPAAGVETLYDVLQYAASTFKQRRAFGYRILEDTFQKEKQVTDSSGKTHTKTWTYFQLSKYHYYTYQEAADITKHLGAGLYKMGLKQGDKLHLFASTSVEWMLMAHGAFTQSVSIVTAYDTLGSDGLAYSINETGTTVCFINADQIPVIEKILSTCQSLSKLIYRGKADAAAIERLRSNSQIQQVLSFEELLELGKQNPKEVVKPASKDISCIQYTSGSTGNPKGVILTHGNVVAAVAGTSRLLQHHLEDNDTMMAYLPLAHVLEFLVENLCIFLGVTLGYGTIRTLTDAFVRNCRGDLQEFAPSIMTGVPQVWETIRKTVLAKVAERGPRIENIFHGAIDLKDYLQQRNLPTGILDKVVFKKVRSQLGGRLRYGLSGGAPLSKETQRFLSLCLAPIICGYGMTESCGMCTLMTPEQFAFGESGSPVPCVEVKLVDVPELGYFTNNNDRPQGEILIRGPSVTSGYYKQDELTAETLTSDGWLRTGDIGEWSDRGTLTIIDRKKNLVKLSHGEYIALEKVESIYKTCVLVENLCVHVDPLYPRPVALMVPVEKGLREFASANGIEISDWEQLCKDERVRKLVLEALQAQGKKNGLAAAEIISNVWLCKDMWTTEMGVLTAAQKLKRKEITQMYSNELNGMITAQKK